jgi:hypothetical protein
MRYRRPRLRVSAASIPWSWVVPWVFGEQTYRRVCSFGRARIGISTAPRPTRWRRIWRNAGIEASEVDPIPIGVFLEYADWFRDAKGVEVHDELVETLTKANGRFEASLGNGERIRADAVVSAPGIRTYANVPDWASSLPAGYAAHTCDLVRFDDMADARVLIIGGRQSAYEWAALIREHGAARIDIVHRHEIPRFERVSWEFVDNHIE